MSRVIYARTTTDGLWIEESAVCGEHKMESPLTVDASRGPVKRVPDDLYFCCAVCGLAAGEGDDVEVSDNPTRPPALDDEVPTWQSVIVFAGAVVILIYLAMLVFGADLSEPTLPNVVK